VAKLVFMRGQALFSVSINFDTLCVVRVRGHRVKKLLRLLVVLALALALTFAVARSLGLETAAINFELFLTLT